MATLRSSLTRTPVQTAAFAVGVGFVVAGVLGFIPGITRRFDMLGPAGLDSGAMLVGVFEVSVLHNVVHLLFGVAGVICARRGYTAHLYLIFGGMIYLVMWLYGFLVDRESPANFMPVNDADNWLHLGLGVGMIGLGALLRSRRQRDLSKPRRR
ncbi:DUF4383 domain-containing protein [Gordonia insulae]|nr:DUF4383 domain-containing protein [Gordonia insulae]